MHNNYETFPCLLPFSRYQPCRQADFLFARSGLWRIFSYCSSRFTVRVSFLPHSDLCSSSGLTSLPLGFFMCDDLVALIEQIYVSFRPEHFMGQVVRIYVSSRCGHLMELVVRMYVGSKFAHLVALVAEIYHGYRSFFVFWRWPFL